MSTDSQPDTIDPFDDATDREEILDLLEDALREAHRKVESGRVYDAEAERVRIKWVRAVGYCADQYRKLLRDDDLEEFDRRLTQLEQARLDQ